MATVPKIYSFEEAILESKENNNNKLCTKDIRLLLGNGFSQAYYGKFSYKTLYEAIKEEKENVRIKKLFEEFGTSNFEAVLSFLKKSIFLAKTYDLEIEKIEEDYKRVRDALADAIVKVHPENTGEIPHHNKIECSKFLSHFTDIFTVNYDLLLYWVLLQGISSRDQMFGDYFYRDDDTPIEYCEYLQNGGKSKKHVLFLHGALHLFLEKGITTKKVWRGGIPLVPQIKEEIENGYYPLVVAEGSHFDKLNQIKSNPYLNHSFSNFSQKKGSLFSFGFSFSEQDQHIIESIVKNTGLKFLWIGIRGDFTKSNNIRLLELAKKMEEDRLLIAVGNEKQGYGGLKIQFFNSDIDIWGKELV